MLWPALIGLPLIVYARRATPTGNARASAVYTTFAIAMLVGIYIAVAATGIIPRIAPVSALAQG
jgi:hypothetical protein